MQEGLTLCSAVINISWNQNQQCMQTSLSGYFFGLQNVSLPVLSWLRGDGLAHQVPGPNVLRAEENSRGSVGGRGHVCHWARRKVESIDQAAGGAHGLAVAYLKAKKMKGVRKGEKHTKKCNLGTKRKEKTNRSFCGKFFEMVKENKKPNYSSPKYPLNTSLWSTFQTIHCVRMQIGTIYGPCS